MKSLELGDRLTVACVRLLGALPWRFSQGFAVGVGLLLSAFPAAKPHRISRINLGLCFPEMPRDERHRLAREATVYLSRNLIASAVSWIEPPEKTAGRIKRIEGESLLDEAIAHGKGLVLLSPHMGCWEVMHSHLCARFKFTIMAKPFAGRRLNALINNARSRLQGAVVNTDESGVRVLLRALKKGGYSYIVPDHVPRETAGVFAPFFGVNTTTGTLTSRLIQATGARALAVTCTLDADGTFVLRFHEADPSIYDEDLQKSVAALNRTIERCVLADISQYQWGYRRFKKIEGRNSPY